MSYLIAVKNITETIPAKLKELLEGQSDRDYSIDQNEFKIEHKIENHNTLLAPQVDVFCKHKDFDNFVFKFKIKVMPGCCGVGILTEVFVHAKIRGRGVGKYVNELGVDLAKKLNYGYLIATTTTDSECHILKKQGWKKQGKFKNPRSSNTVMVYRYKFD